MVRLSIPTPVVVFPCGSMSTSRTRKPIIARDAPRFTAVVLFPTPPFWLTIAMIRAVACSHYRANAVPLADDALCTLDEQVRSFRVGSSTTSSNRSARIAPTRRSPRNPGSTRAAGDQQAITSSPPTARSRTVKGGFSARISATRDSKRSFSSLRLGRPLPIDVGVPQGEEALQMRRARSG